MAESGPRRNVDLREFSKQSLVRQSGLGHLDSTTGFVTGLSLLTAGIGLTAAALVSSIDGWREVVPVGAMGVACLALGALAVRVFRLPRRLRTPTAFAAVAAIITTLVAISTVVYVLTGTFDRFDDALFESVAGFTTTALSVLDAPEATPRAVIFWRALTQWAGGYFSLAVVVALLPFLGVGGVEVSDSGRGGQVGLLSPRVVALMRRLGATYVGLTVAGVVLFAVGGMGPFDAVTYAFTTISTGGFQNHAGSFAYFESDLIEWMAIGGMILAGANIALLARGLRGQLGPIQRSAELRVYAAILVGGTAVTYWLARPGIGSGSDQFREVAFSVTSVVSTTGASVSDWGAWPVGPQVVLLLLMGVGAMSGSTGGGFRIIRAMALFGYVQREIIRQVHPRSVVVVKVGRESLDEPLVSRLIGYQVLFVLVAGGAALALTAFDVDLLTAVSGAISAMSNVGPALGDLSPGGGAAALDRGARVAMMPVMLLGRLEISPVLVGVSSLFATRRRVRRAVRQLRRTSRFTRSKDAS